MKQDQLLTKLRAMIAKTSQRSVARELGVSASYLGDVMRGRRDAGPTILNALGLERDVQYREKTDA